MARRYRYPGDLVATFDGQAVEAPRGQEHVGLALALLAYAQRCGLAVRRPDGTLEPVPLKDVDLVAETIAQQNVQAPPYSMRDAVGVLASIQHGREVSAHRAAERAAREGTAAPTPTLSQQVQQQRVDLVREEQAAEDALRLARERRERHDQLIAAGDVVRATEIAKA